jgi:hypothetical protein
MTAIIHAGPSIRGLDLPQRTDLVFRPPAQQGDIYRATLAHPKAIGLIDGYFEGVPSVWHKEILWALSQGIRVFGSASMGALRAAELDSFGMIGVGRIYQWYRDGILEDDDEVALIHGPPESGFLPLSEPMVNVRSTCEAAVALGVIDRQRAEAILSAAKLLHYRERNWKSVIAAAELRCPDLEQFTRWIPTGSIDQKRLDAAALISEVLECVDEPLPPEVPDFRFEWTDLWDRVMDEWAASEPLPSDPEGVSASAVLDELRLDPDRYIECRSKALQRTVLLREADRRHIAADRAGKLRTFARLREGLGLMRKSELDAWVKNQGLTPDEFEVLMSEETRIESVQRLSPGSIDRHILSILRLTGEYEAVVLRAKTKQRVLEQAGFLTDGVTQEVSPPRLISWFFARRRQAVPDDIDIFIQNLGIPSRQAFYRLLAAEYVYSHTKGEGS